ncbi:hypothetical protein GCM10023085_30970 [Actinomadura viridis]
MSAPEVLATWYTSTARAATARTPSSVSWRPEIGGTPPATASPYDRPGLDGAVAMGHLTGVGSCAGVTPDPTDR